jgi:hypothetical protein
MMIFTVENPRVGSSILPPATSIDKAHRDVGFFHLQAMRRWRNNDKTSLQI